MGEATHARTRPVTPYELSALIEGGEPVLASFYSNWCLACCATDSILERAAERLGAGVEVVKVNVEKVGELSAKYAVGRVPAFVYFVAGAPAAWLGGEPSEDELVALVERRVVHNQYGVRGRLRGRR